MSAATANGTTGTAALSRGQLRKLKAKKKQQAEKNEPTVTVAPVEDEVSPSRLLGRLCGRPRANHPLARSRLQRPAELVVEVKPEVEDEVVVDAAFADIFAKFQIPQEEHVSRIPPRSLPALASAQVSVYLVLVSSVADMSHPVFLG